MKRGTKIGWILIALSVVMSIWVIASRSANANQTVNGMILSDDGTVLIDGSGASGAVTIPDDVVEIQAGAFANNTSITSVVMPDTVTTLNSGVFSGCDNLTSITLSENLTSIPDYTFSECMSLSSISIPSSVTSIGSNAFYNCTSLTSITIPSSVTSIATNAFESCDSLTNITVATGNSAYMSYDGAVYNASGTRLLIVPGGKTSLTIYPSATTIASGAFADSVYLTTLTIPSGITTIEDAAFDGSGIETVTVYTTNATWGTQSDWPVTAMYGYADSTAETFARANSIPFYVLDSDDDDGSDDSSDSSDSSSDDSSDSSDSSSDSSSTTTTDSSDGSSTTTTDSSDGSSTTTTDSTTTADGTAAGSGDHVKDATPTTADPLDPRFFLCIAVFAGGVGVILNSHFHKMKYVRENHKK